MEKALEVIQAEKSSVEKLKIDFNSDEIACLDAIVSFYFTLHGGHRLLKMKNADFFEVINSSKEHNQLLDDSIAVLRLMEKIEHMTNEHLPKDSVALKLLTDSSAPIMDISSICGELLSLFVGSANIDRAVRHDIQLILEEPEIPEGFTSITLADLLQSETKKRAGLAIMDQPDLDEKSSETEPVIQTNKEDGFEKKPEYTFAEVKALNDSDIQEVIGAISEIFEEIMENNKEFSFLSTNMVTESLKASKIINAVVKTEQGLEGIYDELLDRLENLEEMNEVLKMRIDFNREEERSLQKKVRFNEKKEQRSLSARLKAARKQKPSLPEKKEWQTHKDKNRNRQKSFALKSKIKSTMQSNEKPKTKGNRSNKDFTARHRASRR